MLFFLFLNVLVLKRVSVQRTRAIGFLGWGAMPLINIFFFFLIMNSSVCRLSLKDYLKLIQFMKYESTLVFIQIK